MIQWLPRRGVVAKQRRTIVHVDHEHVDVAVVVVVAEGSSAARFLEQQPAPDFGGRMPEPRALVEEELLPLRVARAEPVLVDLRVDVAVGDEDVEAAVVVDVDEPDAPPEVRPGSGGDARCVAAIGEDPGRTVLVQRVVVVREVRDDEVGKTVAVVVAGVDTHAGLRPAVAAHAAPETSPSSTNVPFPRLRKSRFGTESFAT